MLVLVKNLSFSGLLLYKYEMLLICIKFEPMLVGKQKEHAWEWLKFLNLPNKIP